MMDTNTALHHRRSIRLKDYDYRQEGVYCVTICTLDRVCLFGRVSDNGEMRLNEYGKMVAACWEAIRRHFPRVELDAFIVMPNHVHGMIVIAHDIISPSTTKSPNPSEINNLDHSTNNVMSVGATHASPLPPPTRPNGPKRGGLGAIVGSFKSAVTREINLHRNTPGQIIWQRNYYEQIIRDERMLNYYRQYIEANPAQWSQDRYFQEIAFS